jgi:hypothetical protein
MQKFPQQQSVHRSAGAGCSAARSAALIKVCVFDVKSDVVWSLRTCGTCVA